MSTPYVAQILIVPFNFAPKGWAFCDGQLLPLSQNTALFSLLGTSYGGDGKSTFALPNLQGCVPIHCNGLSGQGPGLSEYFVGQSGGEAGVTLQLTEMPSHNHPTAPLPLLANTTRGTLAAPATNATLGLTGRGVQPVYIAPENPPTANMSPQVTSIAGSSVPHSNMMPTLTLSYIICLAGIFPQRP